MFLSQFLNAASAPASAPATSKPSAAAESPSAEPDKVFGETLQGAMGEVPAESSSADEQPVDDVAQATDKNGKVLTEKTDAKLQEESESTGKEEPLADDVDGEIALSTVAQQANPATVAATTGNAKADAQVSMSEGEELLQRLSASHSQLGTAAGSGHSQTAEGKLLPPGQEGDTQLSDAAGKDGGQVGKELSAKDLSTKEQAAKEAVAKEVLAKDGLVVSDGKTVKADPSGKLALAGMTLSGADAAELKSAQGASPLSANLVANGAQLGEPDSAKNSAINNAMNSELTALMGQAGGAKGSAAAKGSAGTLLAGSLDDVAGTKGESTLLNGAETHGAHAAQRATAAGMVLAEADKPGSAQPPLLLSKEQAGDQLADRVQMMMSKNLKHVDIRLDPPELGKLQIKLSMNNDQASVQITVANQQSRDLVEQAMPRLRELLQQQGLQLAQSTVQQDSSRQFAGTSQQGQPGQPGSPSQQDTSQHGGQSGQSATQELVSGNGMQPGPADLWMAAPKEGVDYYA